MSLCQEFSANKAWQYWEIYNIQRDKGAVRRDTSPPWQNDLVPAILNTTMPSHPLNNIVDPDSGGRYDGGITGLQWYETVCRHSL